MRGLLMLILSVIFGFASFGQDSIFHLTSKGKEPEIHRLLQGCWVNIKDSNEKLTVTNKKVKFSRGFDSKSDTNFHKYELKYVDTTMTNLGYDVDFDVFLQGVCVISHEKGWGNFLLFKIYSVSDEYLYFNSKYWIFRRKTFH